MQPNNPYPPLADDGELRIGEGRRVPIGHGWRWVRDAWGIVRRNKGLWSLALLVLMAIWMGVGMVSLLIPLVGNLVLTVVMPVFLVGLFHLAHRRAGDGEFEFGDLFVGFSRKTGPLLFAGLAQAILQLVYMLVMFVLALSLFGNEIAHFLTAGFAADMNRMDPAMMPVFSPFMALKGALLGLVMLAILVPYMAALLFQIPLVWFGDRPAFRALLESLKSTLVNWLPMLWYGVLLLLVSALVTLAFAVLIGLIHLLAGPGFVATLLFFWVGLAAIAVGLLLVVTYFVTVYTAFHDIFAEPASRSDILPG